MKKKLKKKNIYFIIKKNKIKKKNKTTESMSV